MLLLRRRSFCGRGLKPIDRYTPLFSGEFAIAHGATGQDAKGFAIFRTETEGPLAIQALLRTSKYFGSPLLRRSTIGHIQTTPG
jgi:hypothetical protein